MLKLEKEVEGIETVGDLYEVLSSLPAEMPVSDGLGEPIILRFFKEMDTDERSIEIG